MNILKMPVDKRSVRKYIPVLPQSHIARTAVLDSIGLQYQPIRTGKDYSFVEKVVQLCRKG